MQHAEQLQSFQRPQLTETFVVRGCLTANERENGKSGQATQTTKHTCIKVTSGKPQVVQTLSSRGMKRTFLMPGCLQSMSIASVKVPAEDQLPAEALLPLLPRAQASSLPRKPPPIIVMDLTSLEIFSRLLKSSI